MRSSALPPHIGRAHVQSVNLHSALSNLLLRDDLDAADRLERVQSYRSQVFDCWVVPDGALFGRSTEIEGAHGVVRCDFESICVLAESQSRASFATGKKRLARKQPDGRNFGQVTPNENVCDAL